MNTNETKEKQNLLSVHDRNKRVCGAKSQRIGAHAKWRLPPNKHFEMRKISHRKRTANGRARGWGREIRDIERIEAMKRFVLFPLTLSADEIEREDERWTEQNRAKKNCKKMAIAETQFIWQEYQEYRVERQTITHCVDWIPVYIFSHFSHSLSLSRSVSMCAVCRVSACGLCRCRCGWLAILAVDV